MKIKTTIELPQRVVVDDYHLFDYIQRQLRLVVPGIKVKEIGFIAPKYVGMIYMGKLTEPDNLTEKQKIEAEVDGF